MKRIKRSLSALLALVLALALAVPAAAAPYGSDIPPQTFSDVGPNHWAYEYIEEMVRRGAINGYVDGTFKPENMVARVEFAKIMVAAAGVVLPTNPVSSFADVSADHWALSYIEAAKPYFAYYQNAAGQLLFKPEELALREDIAVAVVRLKGYDVSTADLSMLNAMFSDVNTISESLRPYIAVAVEKGLISGYTDGTFRGQNTIARCEVAAILWRAFQYGSDNKVVDPGTTTNPGADPGQTTDPDTDPGQTTGPDTDPDQNTDPGGTADPGQPEPASGRVDMIDGVFPAGSLVKQTYCANIVKSDAGEKIQLGGVTIDHWVRTTGYNAYGDPGSGSFQANPDGAYDTLTFSAYSNYDKVVTVYNNKTKDSVLVSLPVKANTVTTVTIDLEGAVWIVFELPGSGGRDSYTYIFDAYFETNGEPRSASQPYRLPLTANQVDMVDGVFPEGSFVKSPYAARVVNSSEGEKIQLGGVTIDHWVRTTGSNVYGNPGSGSFQMNPDGAYQTLTFTAYSNYDKVVTVYNNKTKDSILAEVPVKAYTPTTVTVDLNGALWCVFELPGDGGKDSYTYIYNAYME